jgi:hypothetical protein
MRRFILFFVFLFVGTALFAQSNIAPATMINQQHIAVADSSKTKGATPKKVHKKMIMVLDTLTLSDYTLSLERVNDNLNTIGDSAKLGHGVVKITHQIDDMTNDVKLIRQNFRGRTSVIHRYAG